MPPPLIEGHPNTWVLAALAEWQGAEKDGLSRWGDEGADIAD